MAVPLTNISLQQVRTDTDLDASGGMTERALRCKSQVKTGPVALSDFSGVVAGMQNELGPSYGPIAPQYQTTMDRFNTSTATNSVSGWDIQQDIYFENMGDQYVTSRLIGYITEGGTYRITGEVDAPNGWYWQIGDYVHYPQVSVTGHNSGWLQGGTSLGFAWELKTDTAKTITIDRMTEMRADFPYVQVALESVLKWNPSNTPSTSYRLKWRNIKMVKV